MHVGDFLYVNFKSDNQEARFIVKVKKIVDTNVICQNVDSGHITGVTFTIPIYYNEKSEFSIIANLGSSPIVNYIDGLSTKASAGGITVEGIPNKIYFFFKPSKEEISTYKKSFASFYDRLRLHNIDKFLREVYFEVRDLDSLKVSKNTIARYALDLNRIQIVSSRFLAYDQEMNVHDLLHEYSHHLYRKIAKDTYVMSLWAETFSNSFSCVIAYEDHIKQLVEDFLVSNESLSNFIKGLDNENEDYRTKLSDRQLFKKYVTCAAKIFKLTVKDLNNLSKSGKYDTLEKILFKNIQPLAIRITKDSELSSYSSTNLKEFFAEVMSTYLEGKPIPNDESNACKKTLDIIRRLLEEEA